MALTLDKFIKNLQKLQAKGYGRYKIAVDSESLNTGNGCWQICPITNAVATLINKSDDDGGTALTKSGQEIYLKTIVLTNEKDEFYNPKPKPSTNK